MTTASAATAVAERLTRAVADNDVDALTALYAPGSVVWCLRAGRARRGLRSPRKRQKFLAICPGRLDTSHPRDRRGLFP